MRPTLPDNDEDFAGDLSNEADASRLGDNSNDSDGGNLGVGDDAADDDDAPEVQPQCGVQNISTEQQPTPPWALRIIGKHKSTFLGRGGGGVVVSVSAYYSEDPFSIPVDYLRFFSI